jgi:DNA repair protein RadD
VLFRSVRHAEHVVKELSATHGIECGLVTGETLPIERDTLLARFKRHDLKFIANVNVLTTGFDAPHIDLVAMLRPTLSPGLYYQMVGRGFRLSPGKDHCLVLDFGGNVLRHGPVDAIITPEGRDAGENPGVRECPKCQAHIKAKAKECEECGEELPPPDEREYSVKHSSRAAAVDVVSDGKPKSSEHEVLDVSYSVHTKKNAPEGAPRTLRVDYRIALNEWVSEWICLEHPDGYARSKAVAWWKARSHDPVPKSIDRAVEIADGGGLAIPQKITVKLKPGEKYPNIARYVLGPKPDAIDLSTVPTSEIDWSDIGELPF